MLEPQRRRLGAGLGRLLQRRHPHARVPRAQRDGRGAGARARRAPAQPVRRHPRLPRRSATATSRRRSEEERREILRWTLWDNHKLTGYIATAALPDEVRPRGEDRPGRHRLARQARGQRRSKVLDRHLFTSEWIAADRITTADLSCVGYLYYDHEFGHDLTAFPNIERWRQPIAALPGWKHPYDLMPGHPIPAGAAHMTDAYIYDAIRTPRGKGRPDGACTR